jgi:hypothetical protein
MKKTQSKTKTESPVGVQAPASKETNSTKAVGTPVLFVLQDGSVKWGVAGIVKEVKEVIDPKWTDSNLKRLGYREAPKTIKQVKSMEYFVAPDFEKLDHSEIYKVVRAPSFSPSDVQEV